jgi:PTH2 family peptidyl-tRNA hydrolase
VDVPRSVKQVLVVRKDLKMRKGKIGAQCAHASMKVLLDRMQVEDDGSGGVTRCLHHRADEPLGLWLSARFTKVCVYVESEAALVEVHEAALAAGLPAALIVDSGRTEFGGVPTRTVVAVGPAWADEVDAVTGALPLY